MTDLSSPAAAGATVAANRLAGRAAEARVAGQLIEEGSTILGSQVTVRTSAGRRVIDHLVQQADGAMVAVEVKSGNAARNARQILKDLLMETEGATIVGKNAPTDLQGATVQIPTVERRP